MDTDFIETVIGSPPEGWSFGHVKLQIDGTGRLIVECWMRDAFAVHEIEKGGRRFGRISHKPTGLEISTFETMDEAAEAADLIASLTNWDEISGPVTNLWQRVFDAIAARFDRQNAFELQDRFLMVWFRREPVSAELQHSSADRKIG